MACEYPDIWVFDENRRVYRRNEQGRPVGGPIWREHWRKVTVVGETSRSWVTAWGQKIPKSGRRGVVFSEEEIDRAAYVRDNAVKIANEVRRVDSYDLLKQIAALVGYEEKPKE